MKIKCAACGGEGRDLRGHPNDPHPKDYGPCAACDGAGYLEEAPEPTASSRCPICGKDTPHFHEPEPKF